jgi:hypothetical protein
LLFRRHRPRPQRKSTKPAVELCGGGNFMPHKKFTQRVKAGFKKRPMLYSLWTMLGTIVVGVAIEMLPARVENFISKFHQIKDNVSSIYQLRESVSNLNSQADMSVKELNHQKWTIYWLSNRVNNVERNQVVKSP